LGAAARGKWASHRGRAWWLRIAQSLPLVRLRIEGAEVGGLALGPDTPARRTRAHPGRGGAIGAVGFGSARSAGPLPLY